MTKRFYVAAFVLHFVFIVGVCCDETFALLAPEHTLSASRLDSLWARADQLSKIPLARELSFSNPLRQAIATYLHGAGIQGGYGFFAPSVPTTTKMIFEIKYPDGRVEHELPQVGSAAAGVRLSCLLGQLATIEYEPLRAVMLKMLAWRAWQQHPGARTIRAILGYIEIPPPAEMAAGKSQTYKFLYACDFSLEPQPERAATR